MLFFFAGYEIDIERIRGEPLRLAILGWLLSLVIAYTLGGVLAAAGVVVSLVYVGSALATTAIGTLIPVLSDTGELRTRFGTYLLAAGAVGEFGPILLLTLVLSTQSALHNALILIAFVALAVTVAVLAVRSASLTMPLFERTIETSSQLAVRWIVVLVFALALVASHLGLDLLLGGFAAGLITRQVLATREIPAFDSKLTAVAFGVFIPFLLRGERHASRRRRPVREPVRSREARDLLRALPGRPGHAGAPALPGRAPPEGGPHGARAVHGDPAAARRGDHDRRGRRGPYALVHRGRPRRRRRPVDARRPAPRPALAPDRC
jgi:Sodium/hydrogen exchanger family